MNFSEFFHSGSASKNYWVVGVAVLWTLLNASFQIASSCIGASVLGPKKMKKFREVGLAKDSLRAFKADLCKRARKAGLSGFEIKPTSATTSPGFRLRLRSDSEGAMIRFLRSCENDPVFDMRPASFNLQKKNGPQGNGGGRSYIEGVLVVNTDFVGGALVSLKP